jgi:hypothetical protein
MDKKLSVVGFILEAKELLKMKRVSAAAAAAVVVAAVWWSIFGFFFFAWEFRISLASVSIAF